MNDYLSGFLIITPITIGIPLLIFYLVNKKKPIKIENNFKDFKIKDVIVGIEDLFKGVGGILLLLFVGWVFLLILRFIYRYITG